MADDSLSERALDAAAHLCALVGIAYAGRAATAFRGWRTVPPSEPFAPAPSLSVVVPARNEERTIERCVRSLLAQTLSDVEVIVVDDRSEDGTRAILRELARDEPRLIVVDGALLPDGWVGKPWALAQGVPAARGAWLLFTDADTWHAPHACASALRFVTAHDADALSLWTFQELGSWAERAILPSILGMIVMAVGSPAAVNDPADVEHALASGQYLLVSRDAYAALGGHAALRGEIVEDVAFARRLKADGRYRLLLGDGAQLVRVRMYASFGELWEGFTKNMYLGANGDLRALGGAALLLALVSAVPGVIAVDALARGKPLRALEAVLCLANTIAVADRGFRRTSIPPRLAWFAPIGIAVCGAIVLASSFSVLSGRGVRWRGRRYTGRAGGTTVP